MVRIRAARMAIAGRSAVVREIGAGLPRKMTELVLGSPATTLRSAIPMLPVAKGARKATIPVAAAAAESTSALYNGQFQALCLGIPRTTFGGLWFFMYI